MNQTILKILLLAQLAATLYMTGLIWFVQIVHYPLFGQVGRAGFSAYEIAHSNLTTFVVAPPMLAEAILAGLLLWQRPGQIRFSEAVVGVLLLAVIWFSTWFLQVPKHNLLSSGFDTQAHQFLVTSNWLRTFAWSARGLLVLWMTVKIIT